MACEGAFVPYVQFLVLTYVDLRSFTSILAAAKMGGIFFREGAWCTCSAMYVEAQLKNLRMWTPMRFTRAREKECLTDMRRFMFLRHIEHGGRDFLVRSFARVARVHRVVHLLGDATRWWTREETLANELSRGYIAEEDDDIFYIKGRDNTLCEKLLCVLPFKVGTFFGHEKECIAVAERIVHLLINKLTSIDINAINHAGADTIPPLCRLVSPLQSAVHARAPSLVFLLLQAGADPNVRDQLDGRTPMHEAVCFEQHARDLVELLALHGADCNSLDDSGQSPLALCVAEDARAFLRRKGALEISQFEPASRAVSPA